MKYVKKYENVLTKKMFLVEYVEKKRSPHSIAKEFGVNAHTIYNYLKFWGIPQENRSGQLSVGDKFGKLTLVEVVGSSKNGTFKWKCDCECGNTTITITSRLKNGNTKSCGCLAAVKGESSKYWKGYGQISGNFFSGIRNCAKHRKIQFDITIEDVWNKYLEQNRKCYLSGLDINFDFKKESASVDRINSSIDYCLENIAICHKDINKIKAEYSKYEFIKQCGLVSVFDGKFKKTRKKPVICDAYFKDILSNAKRRKKIIEITIEDIQKIYCKQGGVCALTGVSVTFCSNNKEYKQRLQTASIDRIDNLKGYTFDNIQIVHKKINNSRKDLTIERYKELCKLVTDFNTKTG